MLISSLSNTWGGVFALGIGYLYPPFFSIFFPLGLIMLWQEYVIARETIAATTDKLATLTSLKAFDIEAAAHNVGSGQRKKQGKQAELFEKKRDLEAQKATAEAAEAELKKRIALATCAMTKLQRQVVCYYLIDGLTLDKVADKIEKSYRYTRSLWQQARLILAEY